jgi:hypothetical protein
MQLRSSSSGCETRPAKGEPARVGRQPCDGVRHGIGEAEACERTGHGHAAPTPLPSRMPKVLLYLKAPTIPGESFFWGEEGMVSGGVCDHGTHDEDGPVTWEALAAPRRHSGVTESR